MHDWCFITCKKNGTRDSEKDDKTGIVLRFGGTLSLSKTVVLSFVFLFVSVIAFSGSRKTWVVGVMRKNGGGIE